MGVADPGALLRPLVVSYTAFSPLLPNMRSGLLSVALIQAFTRFRVLPDMLPCGVRTFLGRSCAHGHPADLVPIQWKYIIRHSCWNCVILLIELIEKFIRQI